ncbi:hypothetical protein [Methylorubrum sp. SB2]|uniref:hypothetical protein n=1 Tax=Methylorubrum subtropicum TaxID=3138812 RepID=UPI00313B1752
MRSIPLRALILGTALPLAPAAALEPTPAASPTSDLSRMSVVPSPNAAAGTLAKLLAERAPLASPTFTGATRVLGPFEGSVDMASPRDTTSLHQVYAVNRGPNTASGLGQTYISFATNPNFDVAHTVIADFRGTHATNTQSKLGQFIQVGSPATATGKVGAAVAEWNLTNRGADTGYQASPSSPTVYPGNPLQQVGGLNLVPEANFAGEPGVGTNVTYGVMVSPSSNPSPRLGGDVPRTHTGFGTDRNALVPTAQAAQLGGGGRGFSFWGGTSAALAPYGVGQAWGFWSHGIDLSRATFAANDPIRVRRGQAVVWTDEAGATFASLTVDRAGQLTLTDAAGAATTLGASGSSGAWATYTPAYAPTGGSGVRVTHSHASYEIVGKTLRMQARFQVAWTGKAPASLQLSLPDGVSLKDAAVGSLANLTSGAGGTVIGTQSGTRVTLGNTAFGASGNALTMSFTAEIN